MNDPNAPFGVDLLIPQVGGNARKTNVSLVLRVHSPALTRKHLQYDYQNGKLNELVDIIIEEKASLFVCAVGVPPQQVVDKLHTAGIPVMNVSSSLYYEGGVLTMP